jgi:DNA modification methylase
MIAMWDETFSAQNPKVSDVLKTRNGSRAFELMHNVLDPVWKEIHRVLKNGAIACINIGDATRTINDNFTLYQNHTRIMQCLLKLGFNPLPAILWRKQTNAPNKFMGSGMLPPGAYVTLEHEYILILRKGRKREFETDQEKQLRRESAFFWEERNVWFSDVWMDLKGTTQNLFDTKVRKRSGAFPFELAYRLINMFSIKGDTVLDPFLGVGTTMYAAMAAGRNSVGIEIDENLKGSIGSRIDSIVPYSNMCVQTRIEKHQQFVEDHFETKGGFKYLNNPYGFPVITRQEIDLFINPLQSVKIKDATSFEIAYTDKPAEKSGEDWEKYISAGQLKSNTVKKKPTQLKLMD